MKNKILILILFVVFLASCVTPEEPKPAPEPETIISPEPAPEPEEIVPEEIPAAIPEIVPEPEPVVQTVPVGGEIQCPEPDRFFYAGGYCIEYACKDRQVKCMKQGNKILRPECECWIYFGEPICSIKAGEETRFKSPLCTRRGQVGSICGAYDSNKRRCVEI